MNQELFSLSDAIAALRTEISGAVERGAEERIKFALGDIDLEFTVVAKRETKGNGTLKFSILGIGADAGAATTVAHEQMQKVTIKLRAQDHRADGSPKDILVGRHGNEQGNPIK